MMIGLTDAPGAAGYWRAGGGAGSPARRMSGAPSYSSHPNPYKNIHGYLRQIFEAFGPERSFWGTDITRMPCSYRQCVTMLITTSGAWSQEERPSGSSPS